jgi:hypothetical protein
MRQGESERHLNLLAAAFWRPMRTQKPYPGALVGLQYLEGAELLVADGLADLNSTPRIFGDEFICG